MLSMLNIMLCSFAELCHMLMTREFVKDNCEIVKHNKSLKARQEAVVGGPAYNVEFAVILS